MKAIVILSIFFLLVVPPAGRGEDLSARGRFAVETLMFSNLRDASRVTPDASVRQHRDKKSPFEGRRVPIKAHVPTGNGPFPILIVSHGAGGTWDTHHAQAQHLASHGYAVLCLEHTGSNRERMVAGLHLVANMESMIHDSDEVLARPKDVSFAIACAEAWNQNHPTLRRKMDLQKVAVMGHSFGAFTTMVVCGMRPALDWLNPPIAPGKGLGPDLRDPRIVCGVALSPQGVGEPFFIRESFGSLRAPLLGISGTRDTQHHGIPAENRKDAFALWPRGEHRFIWLPNARHLDFTDSTGALNRGLSSPTRAEVQPVVRAASLLFLNAHLKEDTTAARRITPEILASYLRGTTDHAEILSK